MSESKEQIIKALYEAAEKSFTALFNEHKDEHFYYCTMVMADADTPCISAQSDEAFEKYVKENELDEEDISACKWSWADSVYCGYGFDEYFGEVADLYEERVTPLMDSDDDDEFQSEYSEWLSAMETVMKMLDEKGIFGTGKAREEVFIFAEESPPDDESDEYFECAKRMNPPAAFEKWYKSFGFDEDE